MKSLKLYDFDAHVISLLTLTRTKAQYKPLFSPLSLSSQTNSNDLFFKQAKQTWLSSPKHGSLLHQRPNPNPNPLADLPPPLLTVTLAIHSLLSSSLTTTNHKLLLFALLYCSLEYSCFIPNHDHKFPYEVAEYSVRRSSPLPPSRRSSCAASAMRPTLPHVERGKKHRR